MYLKFRRFMIALPFLAIGCASTDPGASYPILEQTLPADPALSCTGITSEFRMASNLRAEVLDAHGEAISDAIKDSVWTVVSNPAGAVSDGVWTAAGVSKETSGYARVAAAAGLRMEQLLRYKRDKDCSVTRTRDPSLTDDQILTLLDEILAQFQAGDLDEKQYIKQRAAFLNKLRFLN